MPEVKTEQEPSIEEILESIRQIISEDGTPVEEAPAMPKKSVKPEETLMTAPAAKKPAPAPVPAAKPAAPVPQKGEAILDLTEKVAPEKPRTVEVATAPNEPNIILEESDEDEEHLVSDMTADAAVEMLARLLASNVSVEREMPGKPGPVTLEDMTRELLRPLLREWLDQNLKSIIEKMVAREIERLSSRAMDK